MYNVNITKYFTVTEDDLFFVIWIDQVPQLSKDSWTRGGRLLIFFQVSRTKILEKLLWVRSQKRVNGDIVKISDWNGTYAKKKCSLYNIYEYIHRRISLSFSNASNNSIISCLLRCNLTLLDIQGFNLFNCLVVPSVRGLNITLLWTVILPLILWCHFFAKL